MLRAEVTSGRRRWRRRSDGDERHRGEEEEGTKFVTFNEFEALKDQLEMMQRGMDVLLERMKLLEDRTNPSKEDPSTKETTPGEDKKDGFLEENEARNAQEALHEIQFSQVSNQLSASINSPMMNGQYQPLQTDGSLRQLQQSPNMEPICQEMNHNNNSQPDASDPPRVKAVTAGPSLRALRQMSPTPNDVAPSSDPASSETTMNHSGPEPLRGLWRRVRRKEKDVSTSDVDEGIASSRVLRDSKQQRDQMLNDVEGIAPPEELGLDSCDEDVPRHKASTTLETSESVATQELPKQEATIQTSSESLPSETIASAHHPLQDIGRAEQQTTTDDATSESVRSSPDAPDPLCGVSRQRAKRSNVFRRKNASEAEQPRRGIWRRRSPMDVASSELVGLQSGNVALELPWHGSLWRGGSAPSELVRPQNRNIAPEPPRRSLWRRQMHVDAAAASMSESLMPQSGSVIPEQQQQKPRLALWRRGQQADVAVVIKTTP